MKKCQLNRYYSIVVLAIAIAVAFSAVQTYAQLQTSTLYDLAKNNGGHLNQGFKAERPMSIPDIETLVQYSACVIVGHVTKTRAGLTQKGTAVTSEHSIEVDRVLKGNLNVGAVVIVKTMGGMLRFADGVTVDQYATDQGPLRTNKTYLLFLSTMNESIVIRYELTGGMQGQYKLDYEGSGQVIPADLDNTYPVAHQYNKAKISDFLNDIYSAVGKH